MFTEIGLKLADWGSLDTWIVITAALAAMACALPGAFLVVRRQSMMGDALSHTTLPGVAIAFLAANWMRSTGWISSETYDASRHVVMLLGAMLLGIFCAMLTEWVQRFGRVERSAALGVVFTTMFACGLLLIRVFVDNVDLDPDCVLYGTVETVVMDTVGGSNIPRAAVVGAIVLGVNLLLVIAFFKELRVAAFDPSLATTLGINSRWMHYTLMAVTAATAVSAFETVGSILVIAMLIAPPATAYLLTDRLGRMLAISLAVAATAAVMGHAMAISLPSIVFSRLGFSTVGDASTTGMMAAACGLLFVAAMFFGPRHGVFSKLIQRANLGIKIAAEDVLGLLYRVEERSEPLHEPIAGGSLIRRMAVMRLKWNGQIAADRAGYQLTDVGRQYAEKLVRSHRLWESYMAKHFELPSDHLHETAAAVEHFIGPEIRRELEGELDAPTLDPHGQSIPPETK